MTSNVSGDIENDYEEEDDVTLSDEDFDDEIGAEEEEGDAFSGMSAGARSLSIRRAIEERMERKQMDQALNYLDLDFDEDDFEEA